MRIKNLGGRLFIYMLGLLSLAIGSNLSVISGLGLSPLNAVPYVISLFTQIPMGICITSVMALYVVLQILILRKDFKIIDLTQIIFTTFFGYFIDLTMPLFSTITPTNYIYRQLLLWASIILVALGVSLYMSVNLINLPSEGLPDAITRKLNKVPFHIVKIVMDCIFVVISVALSLMCLNELAGIREGTILAAIFTGKLIPTTNKVATYLNNIFCKEVTS